MMYFQGYLQQHGLTNTRRDGFSARGLFFLKHAKAGLFFFFFPNFKIKMTTSKYEESIKELGSKDDAKKLKALRFIKNSVIGNKTKKELYIRLGVVQR